MSWRFYRFFIILQERVPFLFLWNYFPYKRRIHTRSCELKVPLQFTELYSVLLLPDVNQRQPHSVVNFSVPSA